MSATTDQPPPTTSDPRPDADGHRTPLPALLFANVGCLGYMPFAPGTWGSAAGCLIYWLFMRNTGPLEPMVLRRHGAPLVVPTIEVVVMVGLWIACLGLIAAHIVSREFGHRDPQFVVIDEVSGQLLAYTLAVAPANWKYLLLGFILFRAFDIWKPFPARQAESLPGGWGIMADDWVAGIYAALGLWIARMLGL